MPRWTAGNKEKNMNMKVCDVCRKAGKLTAAYKKIGWKKTDAGITTRFWVDVCKEHETFLNDCKTYETAYEKAKTVLL